MCEDASPIKKGTAAVRYIGVIVRHSPTQCRLNSFSFHKREYIYECRRSVSIAAPTVLQSIYIDAQTNNIGFIYKICKACEKIKQYETQERGHDHPEKTDDTGPICNIDRQETSGH